jgi:hypothetical protein
MLDSRGNSTYNPLRSYGLQAPHLNIFKPLGANRFSVMVQSLHQSLIVVKILAHMVFARAINFFRLWQVLALPVQICWPKD